MRARPGADHASSGHMRRIGHARWVQDIFEVDQSAGPDRGINVNEVAHSTERLAGKQVTVSARIVATSKGGAAAEGSAATQTSS